ncbi:hypothetical protein ACIRVF_07985 [Kitasatospora sp. NPDC101157]|uniref:hypothetical protein n=1 Tax=Kitasatospora sp. NPDC101157 TaxID=3364098 RepID=UPI0038221928
MSTQPADRLANVESLIDAAETRPLTAWEAEEVRSAPRAVRGAQRLGFRREARLQRYLTAWRSARLRATRLREHLDIAEHGRDRAVEAAEQLQARVRELEAKLVTERKVNTHLTEKLQAWLTASDEWADERATFLAENERLRAELTALRQPATVVLPASFITNAMARIPDAIPPSGPTRHV